MKGDDILKFAEKMELGQVSQLGNLSATGKLAHLNIGDSDHSKDKHPEEDK